MAYTIYSISYKDEIKYVGQTTNLERRIFQHTTDSRPGRVLHSAGPEVNPQDLVFSVLEVVSTKELANSLEDYYIEKFNTLNEGWNHEMNSDKAWNHDRQKAVDTYREKYGNLTSHMNTPEVRKIQAKSVSDLWSCSLFEGTYYGNYELRKAIKENLGIDITETSILRLANPEFKSRKYSILNGTITRKPRKRK